MRVQHISDASPQRAKAQQFDINLTKLEAAHYEHFFANHLSLDDHICGDSPCAHARLNATRVLTTENLESPLVTPIAVPRVLDGPIGGAVLCSPANRLDSVTTQSLGAVGLVDAALVGWEITVDSKSDVCWAIGHDLRLDLAHTADAVGFRSFHLVRTVASRVTLLAASASTPRRWVFG